MRSHDLRGVPVASSMAQQILGLLGRKTPADLFLLIPDCRAVHTWFMRSDIDIVFLDGARTVAALVERGRPFRVFRGPRSARCVLELPPGYTSELGIAVGDTVNLVEK